MINDITKKLQFRNKRKKISPLSIWHEDVLKRAEIAAVLTEVVRHQRDPYTISVHGGWGSGKSFLLTRWHKQLEQIGFKSIYYNAWEDDYLLDDPLISIIGQLSNHLKGHIDEKLMKRIINGGKILTTSTGISIVNRFIKTITLGGNVDLKDLVKLRTGGLLSEYSYRSESKKALLIGLTKMARQVKKETKQPLVFIIDELDRCRPTFAIELLERVKHIFKVKNIVFVFGVNHNQLSKTIKSVYGDIDADVYLRRFFNREFILPQASTKEFCEHLFDKHAFIELFNTLDMQKREDRVAQLRTFRRFFIYFCEALNLSLRDIESAINSMIYVGKIILNEQSYMHPQIIAFLIILRLYNNSLYKEFINGTCFASKIMDHLHEKLPMDEYDDEDIEVIAISESSLYQIETSLQRAHAIFHQLELLAAGNKPTKENHLSKRAREMPEYGKKVIRETQNLRQRNEETDRMSRYRGIPVKDLTRLIDLLPPSR